jgi:hypothetical protein
MAGASRALLLALAALAVLLSGCGGTNDRARAASADERSGRSTHQDGRFGYSVRFPNTWHRAATPISPELTDPREILALATIPLGRHRSTNCEAFAGSARSQMGPRDVVLIVQERGHDRGSDGRPSRPAPGPSVLAIRDRPSLGSMAVATLRARPSTGATSATRGDASTRSS